MHPRNGYRIKVFRNKSGQYVYAIVYMGEMKLTTLLASDFRRLRHDLRRHGYIR